MLILTMFLVLLFILSINVPIAIGLAVTTIVAMVLKSGTSFLIDTAIVMFDGSMKFPLIAIPLFILAGSIMNSAGISRRLIAFASALVGFIKGGLSMINIATSMFFAEISGSAVADVAGWDFRLAAHLCLALFILAYVFDLVLSMSTQQSTAVPSGFRRIVQIFTLLLVAQLIYGGFTAGLKAGLGFNTYPKMGEAWIAEAALTLAPFWLNWFENGAMIQFIHRWLGLAVLVAAAVTLGAALSQDAGVRVRRAAGLCVGLVFVQFLLGIVTLITVVPLSWALTHQVFACFVVLGLTYLNFLVRPRAAT